MANYKNYAENLIGNWERDIYAPQAQVAKDVYQTNWNALTNNYNTLKDKLARNFDLAQKEYANTLNDVQNTSFNRMNAANIDLANRGLSGSGVLNRVEQADTQMKGQDVDKALADLLATNNASIEGSYQGLNALGQGQSSLASELAGDLGKLTDAEAGNNQQYAGLLAGIGEGAAQRDAARAGSGSSKRAKELEAEADEIKRRMLIADTLASTDLTDEEKASYLNIYLDVPAQTAIDTVTAYKNNKLIDETMPKIEKLQNKLDNPSKFWTNVNTLGKGMNTVADRLPAPLKGLGLVTKVLNPYTAAYTDYNYLTNRNLQNQQNKINGLNYTDLYNLIYNDNGLDLSRYN